MLSVFRLALFFFVMTALWVMQPEWLRQDPDPALPADAAAKEQAMTGMTTQIEAQGVLWDVRAQTATMTEDGAWLHQPRAQAADGGYFHAAHAYWDFEKSQINFSGGAAISLPSRDILLEAPTACYYLDSRELVFEGLEGQSKKPH